MTEEEQHNHGETDALRALLVRLLIESAPEDARLAQLTAAMEQVVQLARDGTDGSWKQDLASVKADLARLQPQPQRPQALQASQPPLEELLARSDAQLAALLEGVEKRTQTEIARLGTLVSTLTERVSHLESQLRTLSASRGPAGDHGV